MDANAPDNSQKLLNTWDYVIFALSIAISLGIGVYYAIVNKWKNNTEEYLVGGRSMSFAPTAISTMVSFQSAITMLGIPAESYCFGLQYIWYSMGMCASTLIFADLVVNVLYPLKLTSVYEYLGLRFESKAVRLLGSGIGTFSNMIYMGLVSFAPAVALEAVTGYPVWNSIIVTTIAAVIYTSIGGLKAVIWTDVFQSCVMMSMVFVILIKGTISVGGPKQVWDIAQSSGRMNFWNFDPDPTVRHTFWNLVIGSFWGGLNYLMNNSSVQRISCTKTASEAKRFLRLL
ncbi:hypothetical protein EGW08_002172 [Elysia chlorotica]|uniref:Sodium-coupled monocarboxylate transporter 1 n=1 Tax=Elysia chlorotica TaxID=188477 RepID=A0A3S0ZZP9_ELYCH|nr:hypothetical protein EGW08_002172 [Elysia chlorotica]